MRSVFLADDEPLIVEGMQSIIDWSAYNLQIAGTAYNGVEALTKLEDSPVDLVITDIMMPQMTGLKLIREVKARHPHTKFIILSGYEEFNYVREGITLGVENYLLKPVNIDELEATIKHMQHDWEHEEIRQIQMDQHWKILRNNILQRWTNETIDAKEFRERAQLLGIPMSKTNYRAAELRIVVSDNEMGGSGFHAPMIADQCEKIGQEQLPEGCELICFADQDEDIVVLFASSGMEGEEWQHRALDVMKQWMAEDTGASIWCVRGHAELTYLGFPESCKTVKQWLNGHLMSQSETYIVEADREFESAQPDEKRKLAMDKLHKLLRDGVRPEIDGFIDDFFDGHDEEGSLVRAPFLNSAIQVMLVAKDLEKSPDYGEVFGPLSRIHTLGGLKQQVKRVIHHTLDTIHVAEEVYSPHVMAALDYVKCYYKEELSLKTLSQKLDLHPNYLGQLFQQEVGTSFSNYVNQYRIERATQLLLYTDKKTAEVAAEVGFWDASYFYRQFKKYARVSPTELRSLYIKK